MSTDTPRLPSMRACTTPEGLSRVSEPALLEERRHAARAVAALLDLVAVTVEDPVEDGGARAPRALQHQRLVEADAGAALPEPAQQPRSEQGLIGGRIEDDEIVADPVHLREIDAHCGQSIAETPGEWTPRGERPCRCEPVCPVEWLAVVRANGAGCRGNARGAPSPQTAYRFDDYFRRARRAHRDPLCGRPALFCNGRRRWP